MKPDAPWTRSLRNVFREMNPHQKRAASGKHTMTQNVGPADIIFVGDLVLPCSVGIHSEEQNGQQRVRFSVDIAVDRGATRGRRSPVVCYDSIIGAIQEVVDAGHINLMETLAERVAAQCLELVGSQVVTVRVEKLDRVPGAALGVEITRGDWR